MVLFFNVTLSHSACLLPQSSYQLTNQQSHLLPVSLSLRLLTALCMTFTFSKISESDQRTDQPLDRQLVGAAESAIWASPLSVLPHPKPLRGRRTDHQFFGLMVSIVRTILDSLEICQKCGWDLRYVRGKWTVRGVNQSGKRSLFCVLHCLIFHCILLVLFTIIPNYLISFLPQT